ncbi:hypothetical protein IW262DRAFT_1518903 [Armillaria fumosa]|nr:hypothetical protein IW262DRAFT_1518903 [Armillaria fumosa]
MRPTRVDGGDTQLLYAGVGAHPVEVTSGIAVLFFITQYLIHWKRTEFYSALELILSVVPDLRYPRSKLPKVDSPETCGRRRYCPSKDIDTAVGPHVTCSDITVLLRTGRPSEGLEGLYSVTLASVTEHIRLLESEIVVRDERLQLQATSPSAPLQHERDLAVQDLKNHKSIFAPVRRLPNDILLCIFQMYIDTRVIPNLRSTPWVFGYIGHYWRPSLAPVVPCGLTYLPHHWAPLTPHPVNAIYAHIYSHYPEIRHSTFA